MDRICDAAGVHRQRVARPYLSAEPTMVFSDLDCAGGSHGTERRHSVWKVPVEIDGYRLLRFICQRTCPGAYEDCGTTMPEKPCFRAIEAIPPVDAGISSAVSHRECQANRISMLSKDKIYALIGLAAEVEHIASLPSISYQMDVFGAFDVLIDIELRGSGKLCFLSEACGLDRPEGFPSWMPLWYVNDDRYTPFDFETLELEPQILFRAAGNTQAVARRSREKKILNLSGEIVGRIEKIGDLYDRDADDANVEAVRTQWADMVGAGSAERMAQSLTALANEGRISEIEFFALFKTYLQHATFERVAYEEFQAVMLASVCKAGVELL